MKNTIKKLFDWTPSDIAAWEKIQARGVWHFVLWYGVIAFGGFFTIIAGLVTLIGWARSPGNASGLIAQLVLDAVLCVLGGVVNSLLTWGLEEHIYRKISASRIE